MMEKNKPQPTANALNHAHVAGSLAPTYGATAAKLRENGYQPVTALLPYGMTMPTVPPIAVDAPDYLVSEHPVAVWCRGGQPLGALVVNPPQDSALNSRLRALLDKNGLLCGPVRIGSDGRELCPLRIMHPPSYTLQELDGAVAFYHIGYFALIPLDGTWPAGTLLDVPYSKLPAIEADALKLIFNEIAVLPYRMAEEARAPPKPARKAWLGRS